MRMRIPIASKALEIEEHESQQVVGIEPRAPGSSHQHSTTELQPADRGM